MRMPTLLLLLTTMACGEEPKPAAPVAAPPPPTPPPAEAKKTADELSVWYQDCWKAFNDDAWPKLEDCYAEDVKSVTPGDPRTPNGKKMVLNQGAREFKKGYPQGKGDVQLVVVDGNQIVGVTWFHGTNTGARRGADGEIPATNKDVGYLALHVVELNDKQRIANELWVYDMPTIMAQLGDGKDHRPVMKDAWPDRPIVVAKGDDTEKANILAHKAAYEHFNKRDKMMMEAFAENIVDMPVAAPADIVGKVEVAKRVNEFWKSSSDVRMDAEKVIGAGAWTVAIGHLRGKNDGDAFGMKKTDKVFDITTVELAKWEGGKIATLLPFYNSLEMAQDLGLAPVPDAGGAKADSGVTAREKGDGATAREGGVKAHEGGVKAHEKK